MTLGEGGTPLVRLQRVARDLGLKELFVKDESRNPTSSFKDRLSTVAVTHAVQLGVKTVATASSGNAGASLAAYAARAGLRCVVVAAEGAAGPMLTQIRKLGAQLVLLKRTEDRWPLLRAGMALEGWLATSPRTAPVVGSLPVGVEGYKTIAYEIAADLGRAPDWVVLPVAYGDALSGVAQGFADLLESGVIDRLPRLVAAEAHGSLLFSMRNGDDAVCAATIEEAALDKSVDTAQSAYQALKALRETDGLVIRVGNEGLIAAQELLAHHEGLFLELASVMPLVALRQLVRAGTVLPSQTVVCLGTAAGWKDSDVSTRELEPLIANEGPVEGVLNSLAREH
ncbi:pyridoxal-phosphate dependent enzyme [Bradyrhizobium sp. CB1650]|uniref:pyridoxal-phosphate dependent enzyme n=1 Tax=Bradyrhizobium sp. CB1650 TaxID=3039153 RepID=UPI00243557B4|nr:pyridoxal-phosphate dependent enzyme [Bradyrhizobium sp. CB1650]WGD51144.1 pyridoxal-phosphate dependent enzyme [Bradyrhizobium sp. CB1650]